MSCEEAAEAAEEVAQAALELLERRWERFSRKHKNLDSVARYVFTTRVVEELERGGYYNCR